MSRSNNAQSPHRLQVHRQLVASGLVASQAVQLDRKSTRKSIDSSRAPEHVLAVNRKGRSGSTRAHAGDIQSQEHHLQLALWPGVSLSAVAKRRLGKETHAFRTVQRLLH